MFRPLQAAFIEDLHLGIVCDNREKKAESVYAELTWSSVDTYCMDTVQHYNIMGLFVFTEEESCNGECACRAAVHVPRPPGVRGADWPATGTLCATTACHRGEDTQMSSSQHSTRKQAEVRGTANVNFI